MSPRVPTSLRGVHVLVVDDEAEGLDVFRRMLEYSGALVTARSSARSALKAMERVRPNAVIENLHVSEPQAATPVGGLRQARAGSVRPAAPVGGPRKGRRGSVHTLDAHAFWLIRAIRALAPQRAGGVPAIAVSESSAANDRARALAEGFQVYLVKPVHAQELRRAVATVMKGRPAGRAPTGSASATARPVSPGRRRSRKTPTDRRAS